MFRSTTSARLMGRKDNSHISLPRPRDNLGCQNLERVRGKHFRKSIRNHRVLHVRLLRLSIFSIYLFTNSSFVPSAPSSAPSSHYPASTILHFYLLVNVLRRRRGASFPAVEEGEGFFVVEEGEGFPADEEGE